MDHKHFLWELEDNRQVLLATAVVFYGVGDLSTTLWGLAVADVTEVGPLIGFLLALYGTSGIIVGKLVSFAVFWAVWYLLWKPTRVAVPLALTVVGGVVTVWNSIMILN